MQRPSDNPSETIPSTQNDREMNLPAVACVCACAHTRVSTSIPIYEGSAYKIYMNIKRLKEESFKWQDFFFKLPALIKLETYRRVTKIIT